MNEENAKKLLFAVADALGEAGLPFCLGSGTLLGAIREERFIPIDLDIDLWACAEDFEPLVPQIVKAMQKRSLETEVINHRHAGYWDGRDYAIKFSGYGEHGDLTAFTSMPGNIRYNPTHASDDPFCIVFNADDFNFQGFHWIFYGREFCVPANPTNILTEIYNKWEVPDTTYDQPCIRHAYKPNFLTKQNIVYVAMCLDVLHPGHLNILRHAKELGEVWVGLLTDEAISLYKNPPLLDYQARHQTASALGLVSKVVQQEDYLASLLEHKPAYVVHGDDWKKGPQMPSRQLVLDLLPHWGGKLVEIPYTFGYSSSMLKEQMRNATP
jgi:phosphoenolpyruvate phosphomutase